MSVTAAPPSPSFSEVYVVGRGFKGVLPEVMDALKKLVSPEEDIFKGR